MKMEFQKKLSVAFVTPVTLLAVCFAAAACAGRAASADGARLMRR